MSINLKMISAFMIVCVLMNIGFTWIAGSKLQSLEMVWQESPPIASTTAGVTSTKETRGGNERRPRKRLTMPPQESSENTAGFVHVGKTGGSTISKLLRNGCTSFVEGPCRQIIHESIISKSVVSVQVNKRAICPISQVGKCSQRIAN